MFGAVRAVMTIENVTANAGKRSKKKIFFGLIASGCRSPVNCMYQMAAHGSSHAKSSLQTHPERIFFSARTQLELEKVRSALSGSWLRIQLRERERSLVQGLSLATHLFFVVGLRQQPKSQYSIGHLPPLPEEVTARRH